MNWNTNLPDKPGRYIVKTISKYGFNNCFKSERVFESNLSINEKGIKSWSFKNQLFVAYLTDKISEQHMPMTALNSNICIICNKTIKEHF